MMEKVKLQDCSLLESFFVVASLGGTDRETQLPTRATAGMSDTCQTKKYAQCMQLAL